ncbi:hypothetical protein XELAEV_18020466mg [Xenopus laevis]|uniref:Uncharacterized protein n=1 Tax=Xenopus laevis TaxID=8355 RepID=A0A974HQH5_XENLA|nr:hypothetical protein XELAEV_18020466mg [Xenopus laevis]
MIKEGLFPPLVVQYQFGCGWLQSPYRYNAGTSNGCDAAGDHGSLCRGLLGSLRLTRQCFLSLQYFYCFWAGSSSAFPQFPFMFLTSSRAASSSGNKHSRVKGLVWRLLVSRQTPMCSLGHSQQESHVLQMLCFIKATLTEEWTVAILSQVSLPYYINVRNEGMNYERLCPRDGTCRAQVHGVLVNAPFCCALTSTVSDLLQCLFLDMPTVTPVHKKKRILFLYCSTCCNNAKEQHVPESASKASKQSLWQFPPLIASLLSSLTLMHTNKHKDIAGGMCCTVQYKCALIIILLISKR